MDVANNCGIGGVESAPDKCQIASVIVEETLVAKSGMVWVGLFKAIDVRTGFAADLSHVGPPNGLRIRRHP